MKHFGLITLMTVLASCGGSGSDSKQGSRLDPFVIDKMEEAIKNLSTGMAMSEVESGKEVNFDIDEAGKVTAKVENVNKVTKKIIVKVDADLVYTLEEEFANGEATPAYRSLDIESKAKMIKGLSDPLPPSAKLEYKGDLLIFTLNGAADEYEITPGALVKQVYNFRTVINLSNPRCGSTNTNTATTTLKQDGVTQNLGTNTTNGTEVCDRTLSSAELKAIDLSSISVCDETTDSEDVECETKDMSHLVNG